MVLQVDQTLLWEILGVVVAAITLLFTVWNPFKKPDKVELSSQSLKALKKEGNFDPVVKVSFFPHAAGPALELSNLGSLGVSVQQVIVSTDLLKDPAVEMYPVSLALLAQERQLVYASSHARRYFDSHLSRLYASGEEVRPPRMLFSFKCESPNGLFNTKPISLVGKYNNGTIVDLHSADSP